MIKKNTLLLIFLILIAMTANVFAGGNGETTNGDSSKITFWMADYDGMRAGFMTRIEEAFEAEYPQYELDLVVVDWDNLLNKLTTSLAANRPPDASVIGTRWILDFMDVDAIVDPSQYLSDVTLDNFAPGALEAKVDGVLMGVPFAAGSRFMAYNKSFTNSIPGTLEELRELAIDKTTADSYGLIIPGGKHAELTDFCYYFYSAGGDYFDADGKCIVNSPAGVKALKFMAQLANEDKVAQAGYISMDRKQSHPIFFAGKAAYVMLGAWAQSEYDRVSPDWEIGYAQIPPFKGNDPAPLIISDSVVIYKGGSNKEGVGVFLDFLYRDEWKPVLDTQMGFPPVTISAASLPEFQTPMYIAMGEANLNAKGWPLVRGWTEASSIIWDAVQKVLVGRMTVQEALDEAAELVDEARDM